MAENNDALMAYAMGQDNGRCNNGGLGGWGDGWMGLIAFAMIFGGWGGGGWGGFGGGYGGGGAYPVESILQRSLDTQTIIGKLDGLNNGVCDGFYAMQNSINGVGSTVMQTAAQAELSRCQQQAALMQQLYNQSFQNQQCCCETQRLIERTSCDAAYAAATNAANIIQNAHNDTDRVIAKLDAMESARKDQKIAEQAAEIQAYRQNATFSAMLDANTAEILRRSGHECPSAAYIVQPPTPVNFPTNGCGQVNFNGWGNNGCGQGCGSCC
ncbi:hypothetical protein [Flintibacter muris]|uniref:hypothetical protein n=1 Tax=Flintibacter muris TaxID=2941327 RepID=UPI00203BCA97|nr:hypothetical protein [Flintibacter muris]